MTSSTQTVERFIASGQASFEQGLSYNDYACMHHPAITPLSRKPPKDLPDSTLEDFYYYLLLDGQTPPINKPLHWPLLTQAAARVAVVLEQESYPRCRLKRWVMRLLFDGELSLPGYSRKLALLNQARRFSHQPGMLSKKAKLKSEFAEDPWLHAELAGLLHRVPLAAVDFDRPMLSWDLDLLGVLWVFLLGADDASQRLLEQWFNQHAEHIVDIPQYRTRDQLVRPLVWTLFRFSDAADTELLSQALLDRYGSSWCRDYQDPRAS
ncbi:hypothetical protein M1B35_13355 [Pseudomonas sp. MAFF 302046]|jgi:hypothetical protein|uniref:Uncharacterized protein n=1 Tax=Pseudomonas morbosilactucae TaxID=2938197 RepID=A0ABT0JGR7_9PSED|nr:hypothetical protein [Pseudomonas morbosilactucae]MCK9815089.1 hypothetical protein [Pseudomonas morbosilactucae]